MDMSSPAFLQNLPAAPLPSGVLKPNFIDPPTQAHAIKALEGVFISFMLIALAIRLYVRAAITKRWGWDDYTCILAACGSIAHMIVYTQMIGVGFGRHLYDIRAVTFLSARNTRVLTANGVIYPWTIAFARISILLLCLRIFGVDKRMRYAAWFGIIFQALFYTAVFFVGVAQIVKCYGLAQGASQFCRNVSKPLVTLISSVNVVCDFYVLILPIVRVSKLHLNSHRKVGLTIVFSWGLAACATSLARLINFQIHKNSSDILWVQATNAEFTIVEINIIIIVACVSTFPTFYTRAKLLSSQLITSVRSRVSTERRGSSGSGSGSGRGGSSSGGSGYEKSVQKSVTKGGKTLRDVLETRDGNGRVSNDSTIVPKESREKGRSGREEGEGDAMV